MKDLSYGWNNGFMMVNALTSLNDESLRLMEIISKDDKLPDWTLTMVTTALDRLTMARQHIESMINSGYKSNPGWWDKVKSMFSSAKKASVKAAQQASRFAGDKAIDVKEKGAISKVMAAIENLKACATALDMPESQMMATPRWQELQQQLQVAENTRKLTLEARAKREPIKNRGMYRRNPEREGYNEARKRIRAELREEYGDDWYNDPDLKNELYERLKDEGY